MKLQKYTDKSEKQCTKGGFLEYIVVHGALFEMSRHLSITGSFKKLENKGLNSEGVSLGLCFGFFFCFFCNLENH